MDEVVVKTQALIQKLYKVEGNNMALNRVYKIKIYVNLRKRRIPLVCSDSSGKPQTMDRIYLL